MQGTTTLKPINSLLQNLQEGIRKKNATIVHYFWIFFFFVFKCLMLHSCYMLWFKQGKQSDHSKHFYQFKFHYHRDLEKLAQMWKDLKMKKTHLRDRLSRSAFPPALLYRSAPLRHSCRRQVDSEQARWTDCLIAAGTFPCSLRLRFLPKTQPNNVPSGIKNRS